MTDFRRFLLWAILIVAIFMLVENWIKMYAPPSPYEPTAGTQKNSKSATENSAVTSDSDIPQVTQKNTTQEDIVNKKVTASQKVLATIPFSTDLYQARFSLQGAQLRYLSLPKYSAPKDPNKSLVLFNDKENQYFFQSGLILPKAEGAAPTHKTVFTLKNKDDSYNEKGEKSISFSAVVNGIELVKRYTFSKGSYAIRFTQSFKNLSKKAFTPSSYYQIVRDNFLPDGEPSLFNHVSFTGPAVYTESDKYQKINFNELDDGSASYGNKIGRNQEGWIAMVQHYFFSTIIPPKNHPEIELYNRKISDTLYASGMIVPQKPLLQGESESASVTLYSGPQLFDSLKELSEHLVLVRDYGWLSILAEPLFWLLQVWYSFLGNWGWAIVFLTLTVKLLFFPLSAAGYKSMAKMKVLMPRIKILREEYGNDKARMNQEMMKIYRQEKVNPMGGCFPILIQIPVFLALYWVLLSGVEMRGASWLWINDLTRKDPYFILPVLMAASMFAQTYLNPTPADPMQAKLMKFMPLAFSVLFLFFPAGLVLYWVANNVLSISQQWFITKRYGQPKSANDKVIKA